MRVQCLRITNQLTGQQDDIDTTYGPAIRKAAEQTDEALFFGNMFERMDESSGAALLPFYLAAVRAEHAPWVQRWFGLFLLAWLDNYVSAKPSNQLPTGPTIALI